MVDKQFIAYDVETTGLERYRGSKMFAAATCDVHRKSEAWRLDGSPKRQRDGMQRLQTLWSDENKNVAKVMHNAKFDLGMTEEALGYKLDGHRIHDTFIMSKLLQSDHYSHALDDVAWDLCGYTKKHDNAIKPYVRGNKNYIKVPEHLMTRYQIADVERTMLLFMFFWPKIQADPKLLDVYNYEIGLLVPTMRMEERGLCVDEGRTRQVIDELKVKRERCIKRASEEINPGFNLGSTDQVRWLLYDKLKFPVLKRTKKTQKPSTDKDAVAQLREDHDHPHLDLLLEYRSWTRGISTLASYLDFRDDAGRIHPNIRTAGTITGRESCADPNLQNVEKEGRLLNPFPVPARRCFKPALGHVNFHVDYAGIEMRILVHYSDDQAMLDCLNNGDGDVHSLAAEVFFGKRFRDADSEERDTLRSASKNANFAIPYGASAKKVAAILGMTMKEASRAFGNYRVKFPGLSNLTKTISRDVRNHGFIRTAFGRIIHVPKGEAFMGTNYRVQGTAADVLKRAQVRLYPLLQLDEYGGGRIIMVLPIHDEIIFEVPRVLLPECPRIFTNIRHEMIRDFPQLKVPLDVEMEYTTRDWAHKHDYMKANGVLVN